MLVGPYNRSFVRAPEARRTSPAIRRLSAPGHQEQT
jgi:hypothetical protein